MKVLITAGPTREWMDPVRFLSNPSSGAMGISLAQTLKQNGADVTLILGPTPLPVPKNIPTVRIETALEMFAAVKRFLPAADVFVSTAAVGDWRFERVAHEKLKKTSAEKLSVTLVKNPDILEWAGKNKNKLLVGFALETQQQKENALKKLRAKDLDLIIANSPNSFSSARIRAQWIERSGKIQQLPNMNKAQLSKKIARWLDQQWNKKTSKH